jgi:hypothetical protein
MTFIACAAGAANKQENSVLSVSLWLIFELLQ